MLDPDKMHLEMDLIKECHAKFTVTLEFQVPRQEFY